MRPTQIRVGAYVAGNCGDDFIIFSFTLLRTFSGSGDCIQPTYLIVYKNDQLVRSTLTTRPDPLPAIDDIFVINSATFNTAVKNQNKSTRVKVNLQISVAELCVSSRSVINPSPSLPLIQFSPECNAITCGSMSRSAAENLKSIDYVLSA